MSQLLPCNAVPDLGDNLSAHTNTSSLSCTVLLSATPWLSPVSWLSLLCFPMVRSVHSSLVLMHTHTQSRQMQRWTVSNNSHSKPPQISVGQEVSHVKSKIPRYSRHLLGRFKGKHTYSCTAESLQPAWGRWSWSARAPHQESSWGRPPSPDCPTGTGSRLSRSPASWTYNASRCCPALHLETRRTR